MLTFARESLAATLPEVRVLWRAHWSETEGYRDLLGYRPDEAQFLRMDEHGQFVQIAARDTNGKLVGHLGAIVHKSRHTSRLSGMEDYFYLLPEARQGFNALRLLRFAVDELKREGCASIGISEKHTNRIAPLLERVGFRPMATLYMMPVPENLGA